MLGSQELLIIALLLLPLIGLAVLTLIVYAIYRALSSSRKPRE